MVRFSEPVPFYVENFLGFPVGIDVPTGYYDSQTHAWVASDNGRIIEVLGAPDVFRTTGQTLPGPRSSAQRRLRYGLTRSQGERHRSQRQLLLPLFQRPVAEAAWQLAASVGSIGPDEPTDPAFMLSRYRQLEKQVVPRSNH